MTTNDCGEQHVIAPVEPPMTCADLPALEGRLGDAPDDFCVDEIPAYSPSGSGTHRYFQIRKRLMTTQELLVHLARAAHVPISEIGSAGMKDKHAVTTQWVSLPERGLAPSEWELPDGIEILQESRHANKLRTGHLIGNRFTLRLVDLGAEDESRFSQLWQRLLGGFYNGYGAQRFGHSGANLERALRWLAGEFRLTGPKARFYRKLYPSVIQADIFNRYLIKRIELSLTRPIDGEIVRLSGSGARFVVKDPEQEQPRWQSGDIVPMGPMVGSKIHPPAEGTALAVEQQAVVEVCQDPDNTTRLLAEAPGTYRDLLIFLGSPSFEWLNDQSLKLAFDLPAGAYATEVLRELTRRPWVKPNPESHSN